MITGAHGTAVANFWELNTGVMELLDLALPPIALLQATTLERIILEVCICTHNPRLSVLRRCLAAIETQISPPSFRVVVVNNASEPPIAESLLAGLHRRGIPTAVVREQRLGLTAARVAACQQTTGE